MTTKKLTGKFSKLKRPIKDKEGKTVNEIQEKSNIWVEYFEELLNRPASLNPPDTGAAHTDLSIDVTPPTIETSIAIRQIKSGEAAEPDTIPAEALKSDRETLTSGGKRGTQWTTRNQLDELEFADDLALLSHTRKQMKMKTSSVAAASASLSLSIHKGKSKIPNCNTEDSNPITLDGETLGDVESFTYLGSIIDKQGGSDADLQARTG
ncbi:unnamed protein product [Schistosoma mattheei]|uniref:Uncharacterized protein n=1 Tax=Schistosoma mattheei TaxID=31246 RepID=A0A183NSZ9_9TREM|nr:unnamed protein product [Schistosoma mattheei]